MNIQKVGLLVVMLMLAASVGCGTTGTATTGTDRAGESEEPILNGQQGLAYDLPRDDDVCLGNLSPRIQGEDYVAEVAYVPLSAENPFDQAAVAAREQFANLMCGGQEDRCDEARRLVRIWRRGQDTRQACVMAVVRRSDFDDFVRDPWEVVRAEMAQVAAGIAARMRQEISEGRPAIILDSIEDNGVRGGPRAELLHREILAALTRYPLDIQMPPQRYSGLRPQEGRGILRGELHMLPESSRAVRISWQLFLEDNRQAGMGSVEIPVDLLPELDRRTFVPRLPPNSEDVRLHLDSRPGGGLCNGQETELWLEAAEPLYVRVINLYGGGSGGLVIYSTGAERLPANQLVSLGKFEAMKSSDIPVERFIVVAAPTEEALGRFASIEEGTFCRMPGSMAYNLHNGRDLPQNAMDWFFSLNYQLMSGEECGPASRTLQADLSWLADVSSCW